MYFLKIRKNDVTQLTINILFIVGKEVDIIEHHNINIIIPNLIQQEYFSYIFDTSNRHFQVLKLMT